jgi:Na+-transporting NADH:ubiquinone oxidoreductase subunit NqrB
MGVEIFWLSIALLLSALTSGLYRGQFWARWSVIALGTCAIGFLFVGAVIGTVENWRQLSEWGRQVTPGGYMTGELRAQLLLDVASDIGRTCCFAAPLALLICVLCHRDVAPAFHRHATKRSNHAMQRTPPRPDA